VRQLDSDEFEKREEASRELEKVGAPALEALRKAAKDGSARPKGVGDVPPMPGK
jgi:hypothetical protein